jgi:hypothetical protein
LLCADAARVSENTRTERTSMMNPSLIRVTDGRNQPGQTDVSDLEILAIDFNGVSGLTQTGLSE